jgi:hypothetical protein
MEWTAIASEEVVNVACADPFSTAVSIAVTPSLKITVPVGVTPLPVVGVTVAVNVTDWPYTDGLALETTEVVVLALFTVNVWAFDAPPPPVLNTVILNVPEMAMSLAGTAAVNCVSLTYVVVRFAPLNCTVDTPLTKFVPVTVIVNAVSPTVFVVGLMLDVVGVETVARGFVVEFDAVHRENPSRPEVVTVRATVLTVPPFAVQVAPLSGDLYRANPLAVWPFNSELS